ncbi:hypothetical protein [Microvirga sp. TS319]|uniref:hypothetical protein n=1 Tax=Microvirga sp. TS319 TaxID=3241165 RepID=UPI00351A580F
MAKPSCARNPQVRTASSRRRIGNSYDRSFHSILLALELPAIGSRKIFKHR